MPTYRYKARSKESYKLATGLIEAKTQQEAIKKLRTKELLIISLKPDYGIPVSLKFLHRVSSRDRILFARELAVMIRAGLPILQALKAIKDQTPRGLLQKTIVELIHQIEGGTALSDAFAAHPQVFPHLFVSITRSGEKSGKLDEVLERLATQLEKDYDLTAKIRSAMIYPIFVLCALIGVIILIMIYIIPQLQSLFDEINVPLPLITRLLLGMSEVIRRFLLLWFLILVGILVGLKFALKRPSIRLWFERIYFRTPIFGKLYRRVLMSRFTHTLATMIASGLPMIESLQTTGEVMNSPSYNNSLDNIVIEVKNGQPLSKSLLEDKAFPPMIGHMVAIGEGSGSIDSILETVGGFFDKEIENLTRNLSTLLEPFLMVIMGLGVGLVVASVIVPIYNLVSAV